MACLSISIGILRGPTEAATIPLSLPIFVQEEYACKQTQLGRKLASM
jgi:hypothetical protein